MVQTSYSNSRLLEMAKRNYRKLLDVCEILDLEGYWGEPQCILKKPIASVLDMYVQAVLLNLAFFCNRLHKDEREFITRLPAENIIGCTLEGELEGAVLEHADKIVNAPPILLQLCGVRDMEKKSDFSVQFFDSLLNILLAMSYLNNAKDTFVTKYVQNYYEKISVFMNNRETREQINPRYVFKKLSSDKIEEYTVQLQEDREEKKQETKEAEVQNTSVPDRKELSLEEEPDKRLQELMQELNQLVGLPEVKKEINSLINLIKVKKMREHFQMPSMDMTYHMVFTGNPGTGKTTVARLIAQIYKELGILPSGNLVETDRAGLIAGYVGQTALKVKEVVDRALGGVLFIDEAYSLTNNAGANDFGGEAIDTLVKMMEDNRDNLVVIVAGYRQEMKEFLKANTGLISRFNKFIDFKDYSQDELMEILDNMAGKSGVQLDEKAKSAVKNQIFNMSAEKTGTFGNARGIRNVFEKIMVNQANRIVECKNPTAELLQNITEDDISNII